LELAVRTGGFVLILQKTVLCIFYDIRIVRRKHRYNSTLLTYSSL
jgi:hypothetical protein